MPQPLGPKPRLQVDSDSHSRRTRADRWYRASLTRESNSRSRNVLKATGGTKPTRKPNAPPDEPGRLIRIRPSDGRGQGGNPRPPCAFKVSMIEVFCNSHYFTQLAALVIDARAE